MPEARNCQLSRHQVLSAKNGMRLLPSDIAGLNIRRLAAVGCVLSVKQVLLADQDSKKAVALAEKLGATAISMSKVRQGVHPHGPPLAVRFHGTSSALPVWCRLTLHRRRATQHQQLPHDLTWVKSALAPLRCRTLRYVSELAPASAGPLAGVPAGRIPLLPAAYNEFGGSTGDVKADVLANATPLGMIPNTGTSSVPAEMLGNFGAVFDAVYTPLQTQILKVPSWLAPLQGCCLLYRAAPASHDDNYRVCATQGHAFHAARRLSPHYKTQTTLSCRDS